MTQLEFPRLLGWASVLIRPNCILYTCMQKEHIHVFSHRNLIVSYNSIFNNQLFKHKTREEGVNKSIRLSYLGWSHNC